MDIPLTELFALASLGLVTGFLAGLLGIGGGMVMVPFLTFIISLHDVNTDLSVKMAIATAMTTIVFTSISSVRAHQAKGNVKWDVVKQLTPGLLIGSAITSLGVFNYLHGAYLGIIFALFITFSATQIFLDKKPSASRQFPAKWGGLIAGIVIGFISGLVGAGGAFISVPFMLLCNIPILNAVATSAALGFPIAASNALGYIYAGSSVPNLPPHSFGYVWLPGLIMIASMSVLTAPYGARTAQIWPVKRLKQFFASILYILAVYMIFKSMF
ncbi:MAG: sulfite exporter TauE/SafE family protein [Burkholderiaceae bacterium]|jgi:uncharacterized membrane protein YfcA